jgi:hypothetical protein
MVVLITLIVVILNMEVDNQTVMWRWIILKIIHPLGSHHDNGYITE